MASAQSSCTLCEEDSLDTPAASWCPECETFLCVDCDRHHKRSKASKHHTTVSVDAFHNLPDAVKSATNMCTEHAKKQEFYCPKHACACCLQCLNDKHSGCAEVKHLAEIVQNIKSSERVTSLESNLDCLKKDYDVILKHMRQRLGSVDSDKSEGMSKIKTMRSEVNKYMDIVEQILVDKLNTECEEIKTETANVIEEVEQSRSYIDDTRRNLEVIVENATELQVYNYLESLEEKKEFELIKIQKFKEMKELDDAKIEVEISNGLATFYQEISNFGNVKLTTSNSDLVFATGNTSTVQNATLIRDNVSSCFDINNVHVTSIDTFSIPADVCTKPGIIGCVVLDCDIVLLDRDNKTLYQFSTNGEFIKALCSFPDYPSSICRVNAHKVAVTFPNTKTLSLLSLTNGETINEKKMDGKCYGISCNGKELVITVTDEKRTTVVFMNTYVKHLRSFQLDSCCWTRVFMWKDKVYLSNWSTDTILCCNENGDRLWKYDEENLKTPLGLAVDGNGFTFVACRNNNSLVVLSSKGTESKVLLSGKDGIHTPTTIAINNNNGRICVANKGNKMFFCFSISTNK